MEQQATAVEVEPFLQKAFEASKRQTDLPTPEEALELHRALFTSGPETLQKKPFEIFSLVDPTITIFVANNTGS